jgi:hypothetical protein
MAKFVKKIIPPSADPAEAANAGILRGIRTREAQAQHEKTLATDLGLDLKDPPSDADNASDFLADEWDRKTFGDSIPTYTRVLYGPDRLLISCPSLKDNVERMGLEEYANTTAETILLKQENAVPDPVMKAGLRAAIARFGVASVADAFRKRIMSIPCRTVEIEADRSDAMIDSDPMKEAVERYGTPGMAPKFLSERCIGRFGLRGYVIVKNETGEPVMVGTLILGEIPIPMAEARKRHYAEESNSQVRDQQENFEANAAEQIDLGGKAGLSVLKAGEKVRASAAGDLDDPALTSTYLGRERETGINFERQR